jgi:CBS domain containing-hemolysin-like protein
MTFVADARAKLEKVSEVLKIDLTGHDIADDIDTLGGLVTTLAGRVPAPGDMIAGPNGLQFEVLEADPRRLKKVRIAFGDVAAERPSLVSEAPSGESQKTAAFSATSGSGPSSSAA